MLLQIAFPNLGYGQSFGPETIVFEEWKQDPKKERPGWGYEVELWMIESDGSNLTRLTAGHRDKDPAWSPDRKSLLFSRDRVGLVQIGEMGELSIVLARPDRCFFPQWLNSEEVLFTAPVGKDPGYGQRWRLNRVLLPGDQVETVDLGMSGAFSVQLSPDRKRIAFSVASSAVYVADVTGENVRQLESLRGLKEVNPMEWYPDGQHLVVSQGIRCLKVPLDGGNFVELTGIQECAVSWSPDGARSVFQFNDAIWIGDSAAGNKRLLTWPSQGAILKRPVW